MSESTESDNDPIGTKHAHYAPPSDGPFRCDNCQHYSEPHFCNHPDVIEDAKAGGKGLKMGSKDRAIINSAGCCNYFRTKGE